MGQSQEENYQELIKRIKLHASIIASGRTTYRPSPAPGMPGRDKPITAKEAVQLAHDIETETHNLVRKLRTEEMEVRLKDEEDNAQSNA
jgi:hypothetical protein